MARTRLPGVLKNVISPVQLWLLSQGMCVGCGMPLSKAEKFKGKKGISMVRCKCGRIFVQESKSKAYRRALLEEV